MSAFLDAVQLRAIGWQKVEGDPPSSEDFEVGLNGLRGMKGGVVHDDRQRLTDLLTPQAQKADKEQGIEGTPHGHADDLARGEEGADHIQPFAPAGLKGMLLAHGGSGTPIGVSLGEPHFIEVPNAISPASACCLKTAISGLACANFTPSRFFSSDDGCVSRRIPRASTPR